MIRDAVGKARRNAAALLVVAGVWLPLPVWGLFQLARLIWP